MELENEMLVLRKQFKNLYLTIEHEHARLKSYLQQIQPQILYLDTETLKILDDRLMFYRQNIKKQLDVLLSDPVIKPFVPIFLKEKALAYQIEIDKALAKIKLALSEYGTKQ